MALGLRVDGLWIGCAWVPWWVSERLRVDRRRVVYCAICVWWVVDGVALPRRQFDDGCMALAADGSAAERWRRVVAYVCVVWLAQCWRSVCCGGSALHVRC